MGKKEQASQPALQTLKEYAVITAAVLIMDIGIYVFKFPNNFSFGGVSGMAVVICRFLPFTASQINLDRKSTRLNSSHPLSSRMPSSA